MDRFTSYSGNGYEERKSQELRSINSYVRFNKEKKKIEREEENRFNNGKNSIKDERKVEQMKHNHTPSLAQNHLKLLGNNQFKRLLKKCDEF